MGIGVLYGNELEDQAGFFPQPDPHQKGVFVFVPIITFHIVMSLFILNRNNRNAVLFQVKQKSEASKLARSKENKNLGLTQLRDNIPGNDQTIG